MKLLFLWGPFSSLNHKGILLFLLFWGHLVFCHDLNYPLRLNPTFLFGSNLKFSAYSLTLILNSTTKFLQIIATLFVQNKTDTLAYYL